PETGSTRPEASGGSPGSGALSRSAETPALASAASEAAPAASETAAPLTELAPVNPLVPLIGVAYGSTSNPGQPIITGPAAVLGCGGGTGACVTTLPAIQRLLAAESRSGYADVATSLAVTRGGGPGDGGHGGTANENPPMSPTPGPAPSG